MASNKSKKYNIKKGLLGRSTGVTTPVIIQENQVARIEKELDNSREAKKKRKAAEDNAKLSVSTQKQHKK